MTDPRCVAIHGVTAAVVVLLATIVAAGAQTPTSPSPPNKVGPVTINYVYAAQFGMGGYTLGGLDVTVVTIPASYTWDIDNPIEKDGDQWAITFLTPLAYGHYDFDDHDQDGNRVDETKDTLGWLPGVEVQIPVLPGWVLKPAAQFGFAGGISGESDWAYVWGAGVRSRYDVPWRDFRFSLGNALIFAGNENVGGGQAESFGTFRTGLAARHPLGFKLRSLRPDIEGFFVHHHFIPSAEFDRFRDKPLDVKNQFEFGASIGLVRDWTLLLRRNPRAGVAYRFGDGLEGVRFTLGFPF